MEIFLSSETIEGTNLFSKLTMLHLLMIYYAIIKCYFSNRQGSHKFT